jgi:transcriptional regulator with XRE-family HTH domain
MKLFRSDPDNNAAVDSLIGEFSDQESGEEYRYAYAEEHLNTWLALQVKALRDQRGLSQLELAQRIGAEPSAIVCLEDASLSEWETNTLKKIARALDVRLKISFETFGTLLEEDSRLSRRVLERTSFEKDPAFRSKEAVPQRSTTVTGSHVDDDSIKLDQHRERLRVLSMDQVTHRRRAHRQAIKGSQSIRLHR